MKPVFSIRYKFLAATTALLAMCVGTYLWLASSEFKSDKKTLVYDYNELFVNQTAADLDRFLATTGDTIRLIALLNREPAAKREMLLGDLLRENDSLVFVGASDRFKKLDRVFYEQTNFTKTYSLAETYFTEEVNAIRPIPFAKIQITGHAIWNATVKSGPPMIGVGRLVVEEDEKGVPISQFAVVGYVKADRLLNMLRANRAQHAAIYSDAGELLAHPEVEKMASGTAEDQEVIELAAKTAVRRQVFDFFDRGERFLGAFARTESGEALVVTRVPERRAFQAVNRLARRSLLFTTTLLTVAFIVAIFFSQSLTKPLDILMGGMRKVSDGDLSSQINVPSKDEIALLAHSFNRMISDLKSSREELEKINQELEQKVKDRTRQLELQNQAVKEAQEALLKTTRFAAIGEVAGQAAHEVLNPLTSIVARLQKLRGRIAEEQARELTVWNDINKAWSDDVGKGGFDKLVENWRAPSSVRPGETLWQEDFANIRAVSEKVNDEFRNLLSDTDFLLQETQRIGRIVNSFRSLSSVNAEPQEASLNSICDKSTRIMADLAEKANVKLTHDFGATLDAAIVGEDEVIQVLTNLIRNSIHAVKSRAATESKNSKSNYRGEVIIRTANVGDGVEISVIDNGLGIPADLQEKLFEKNFTTKSRDEGTGIGLSISRRLVRAFKGDLWLKQSAPGKGAEFAIRFPHSKKALKGVA